jgi:hypothetical protein
MLRVKGDQVSFDLVDGRWVEIPKRWGFLHDPEGDTWKNSDLLFLAYRDLREEVELTPLDKKYYGDDYDLRAGKVVLPPRDLSRWRCLGEVARIFYYRPGKHEGLYQHPFNQKSVWDFLKGKEEVTLYEAPNGKAVLLELPEGAIVNHRGVVWP